MVQPAAPDRFIAWVGGLKAAHPSLSLSGRAALRGGLVVTAVIMPRSDIDLSVTFIALPS